MQIQRCCLCNDTVKIGLFAFALNKNLDIHICKKCNDILLMVEQWKLDYPGDD